MVQCNHQQMDSYQINRAFSQKKYFGGVFPRDCIPFEFENLPVGIIVNTDSQSEKGEHWVAIIIKKNKTGEYFDPFGLPPLHKDFIGYLNKVCSNGWIYNSLTLQHIDSKSCGLFCICYINSRFSGQSFSDFISSFSVNFAFNEKILLNCTKNGVCFK